MMLRLQKYLAEAGIASRRASEELITAGRVQVNGETATLGMSVDPDTDVILFDGKPVKQEEELITLMLYKPKGVVSTSDDPQGRKTVQEYVKDIPARLYNVGRLDINSEGLLLMTNDGEWANLIAHPRHGMTKLYRVWCRGPYDDKVLARLRKGVYNEGEFLRPHKVFEVSRDRDFVLLEMVLDEGRKREIRRLCYGCGLEVLRLLRLRVGGLKLLRLKPGKFRELTAAEVEALRQEALAPAILPPPRPAVPPAKRKPAPPPRPNPVVTALQRRLGGGKA